VRVCPGCGRVEDEEGQWHLLHRYLEDRVGLEAQDALCTTCARGEARPAVGRGAPAAFARRRGNRHPR
jgi:hypothetical protein